MKGDLGQSELFQAQNLSSDQAGWGDSRRKMAGQLEEEENEGEDERGKEKKSANTCNHLKQDSKD